MASIGNEDTTLFPIPGHDGDRAPAAGPKVHVEFAAQSHIGKVRAVNQDRYLIGRISRSLAVLHTNLAEDERPADVEGSGYAMVVADGMGGMAGGERASALALRTGVKLVLESSKWALSIDDEEANELVDRMRDYFHRVNATIVRQTEVDPTLAGMGTTLTVAYSVGRHAFVVHAGDSRAYLFREGELRRLTRDHNVAQRLVDSGLIRPEDAETHRSRRFLTNYVGSATRILETEIVRVDLLDGDRLMLCTDGLTGEMSDPEIATILMSHNEPEPAVGALIDRALDHGGDDNITVTLARYAITG